MDQLAAQFLARTRVIDLGRPLFNGVPQSPAHPTFRLSLSLRHGQRVRDDGGASAADELLTGTHVGTHIDAVGHISQHGLLHGGAAAEEVQTPHGLRRLGIDEFAPRLCRGVLLDIPAVLGEPHCPGGYEVTVDDLDAAVRRQGTPLLPGDAVLIRTGWGTWFDDAERFAGRLTGTPGIGVAGARWLARAGIQVAGAETLAFECQTPDRGILALPVHGVLLVEHGINLIEVMDLDELALGEVHEFVLALAPLPLRGATGSPLRPLALCVA